MYQLRFLSSRNLEKFRILVVQRVSQWIQSWTLSSAGLIDVQVRRVEVEQAEIGSVFTFSDSPLSDLRISLSEVEWPVLIWGESAPTFVSDEIQNAIISEVQSAFVREVLDACPSESTRIATTRSFPDMMELRIVFADLGEVLIYTRQSFVATILNFPREDVKTANLKGIYESIKDVRLKADVVLKLGEIPLASFSHANPGCVVESKLALTNNFSMRVFGKDVFNVSVGKREAFVAVSVKGKTK